MFEESDFCRRCFLAKQSAEFAFASLANAVAGKLCILMDNSNFDNAVLNKDKTKERISILDLTSYVDAKGSVEVSWGPRLTLTGQTKGTVENVYVSAFAVAWRDTTAQSELRLPKRPAADTGQFSLCSSITELRTQKGQLTNTNVFFGLLSLFTLLLLVIRNFFCFILAKKIQRFFFFSLKQTKKRKTAFFTHEVKTDMQNTQCQLQMLSCTVYRRRCLTGYVVTSYRSGDHHSCRI